MAEVGILYDIVRLVEKAPLAEALPQALERLGPAMGLRAATVAVATPDGEVRLDAAWGLPEEAKARGRYRVGEGVTGEVVRRGETIVVPRVGDDARFLDRTGAVRAAGAADDAFVCVPIKVEGEVVGTLGALVPPGRAGDLSAVERFLAVVASVVAQAVRIRRECLAEEALRGEVAKLRAAMGERPSGMVGSSAAIEEVYALVAQVAPAETTVLLRGETGTGKELVARAIHEKSRRAKGPFVAVNCGALPEHLVESELFGHERGAFTGAVARRRGRFERARGGTLFLDEVGELPPAVQVKLLRVLTDRTFERVGGEEVIEADCRIVAATNRDLEKEVALGRFREDLYYRLSVFPIYLPPLRERRSDIPLLVDHFLAKYSARFGKEVRRITTPAIDALVSYHWPGNVRELENVIERAVVLSEDGAVHAHHLPPTLQTARDSGTAYRGTLPEAVARLERSLIEDALKQTRGNAAAAARLLGITERQMGVRIRRYGIEAARYRG